MKIFIWLFLSISIIFAQNIKIATYNVENLFDGKNNGNEYQDFKIGKGKWSSEKSSKKLENISRVVTAINADIIAIEEVENEAILKELAKLCGYGYVSFSAPKNSPVGLGIMSKIKPKFSERYPVSGVKTRDILRVVFQTEGKEFSIFVNHFPAYKKNGYKNQQKAERTLRVALAQHKYAIALGDFNTPYSKGKKNLLNDIVVTKNYTNLWEKVKHKQRYSFAAYGKKRAIDHVLLSPEFFEKNGDFVYVCDSFKVFKADFMMNGDYVRSQNGENLYSDHLPLVFEISSEQNQACGIIDKIFN
ncbi:MAG: endonuclease/exonuclease/phosphatase family protein [Campylobacter sp.]|nr:endonuclease/exonuclease/phosphatase family protein [Campylobacter sp.]